MKLRFFLIALFIICQFAYSQELSYQESSTGLQYPDWEGGHTELEFADINNDGNPDIVTIGDHGSPYINSSEHGIMVYFGDGAGTWSVQMVGNFGYGGIAVGDVNNDGYWDVGYGMHHNYSGTDLGDQLIEVALGDGTGSNWIPWDDNLATAGESWGMFGTDFADFNNDGLLDLVSISFGCCAGLHVYLNNGDGTWTHSWGFTGGNSDLLVTTGDFNGDGFLDIATSHEDGTVYFGDGSGQFVSASGNLPTYVSSPSASDVDNDGRDELAFCYNGQVQVWKWSDNNTWIPMNNGLPSSGYYYVDLIDLNGDGFSDVIASGDNIVTAWLGDGSGNWTQATQVYIPGDPQAFRASSDVDHNGRIDFVVLDEEGTWPAYQNHLRFFKESHPPESLRIRLFRPASSQKLPVGSARFIKWVSEVPGGLSSWVKLEFSTTGQEGPWITIVDSFPNGGIYQWIVPNTVSANCYLRATVYTPEDSAQFVTQHPFEIFNPVQVSESSFSNTNIEFKTLFTNRLLVRVPGSGRYLFSIYDPTGRRIFSRNLLGPTQFYMDLNDFNNGVYFAEIRNSTLRMIKKVTLIAR